jgi:Protein of unknown function (DUF3313)
MRMLDLLSSSMVRRTFARVGIALVSITAGCASTVQSQPSAVEKAMGENPPLSAPAGFLGKDYSLLQEGKEGQAALIYVNPNARWSQYNKILLEPVQFWDAEDSAVKPANQHMLTAYFYNQLKEDLEKHFKLVDQAGPGVMTLQVALNSVKGAKPGLRSVSVYVPMARLINGAQSLATGSYAFVGSAEGEGKLTDSETGELLAAFADRREGGMTTEASAQRTWGDTKNVMDYWAQKMSDRLYQLHTGTTPTASE